MKQAALRISRGPSAGASPRPWRKGRALWPDPYPGTEEPTLDDLFNDDVMQCVMISDRVAHESLASLIETTRGRLGL
ncbi:hypothetical protein [Pararhodospirillum oryzae]|uniref:Uncharacterized protein n=1 Tax=Pararhodospirillum oryzae TaxID=478448 RepID=A0A512H4L3_9PROT|nr:hypothetical protein [Pararhodospirillum oryzae]GEO80405.1 hypothetical protein ROR02_05360 [Pararhodospirillum oryzae]